MISCSRTRTVEGKDIDLTSSFEAGKKVKKNSGNLSNMISCSRTVEGKDIDLTSGFEGGKKRKMKKIGQAEQYDFVFSRS